MLFSHEFKSVINYFISIQISKMIILEWIETSEVLFPGGFKRQMYYSQVDSKIKCINPRWIQTSNVLFPGGLRRQRH